MAGIARGKLIYGDSSGNPAVLAVGSANEVLTHDGTDFGWAAAGGGGLTYATQYRLSADTTRGLLTSNWEAPDTEGYGALGTAVGESSGIFSFPGTGYWLITFTATGGDSGDQQANYIQAEIHTTSDNSSYTVASFSRTHPGFGNPEAATTTTSFLFDVTNISNDKVKLKGYTSHTDWTIRGDTGQNETHDTFIHLGDT